MDTKRDYTRALFITATIYLLVQGIALWIGGGGFGVERGIIERVENEEGIYQPMVPEPEKPESVLFIFVMILFMTAVMLILMKMNLDLIIKLMMSFVLLFGLSFTLYTVFDLPGILIAFVVFIIYLLRRDNIAVTNLVLILVIPGIGSWLGASLPIIPAFILLLVLSVYDVVAVFGTKHMVTMAEGAKGKIPLMFSIPVGDRMLGLGTGDLAIPVMFSVSILKEATHINSVAASLGGLLGLIFLFIYISQKKDVTLPALPPIAAGLILGFVLSLLVSPVNIQFPFI